MKLFSSENELLYEGAEGLTLIKELKAFNKSGIASNKINELVDNGELKKVIFDHGMKLHVDLKFKCIDDWNRPIFRIVDSKVLLCSVENLFPDNELYGGRTNQHIIDYYKQYPDQLCVFGTNLDDDPLGSKVASFIVLNFIDA